MPSRGDATPAPIWLPELGRPESERVLGPEDAHYVTRVCRVGLGEVFEATDGEGARATLRLLSDRGEVRVGVEALRREPRPASVLVACGAPEKDRADWMIEKLAELGVTDFQPLACERADWERWSARRDRFDRLALAALRQSRRAWRLRIHEPLGLDAWREGLAGGGDRWLADPTGAGWPGRMGTGPQVAAIGPSAGFSGPERERLVREAFVPVRLAAGRLRTETAAIAWAALRAGTEAPENRA